MPIREIDLTSLFAELVRLQHLRSPSQIFDSPLNTVNVGNEGLSLATGESTGAIFGYEDFSYAGPPTMERAVKVLQRSSWDFWARWYEAMLEGRPLAWSLQRSVAMLSDDVWKAGPEAVAEAIRRIEDDLNDRSGLDEAKSKSQAQTLLKAALKSELQARGLSDLIKMAVKAYEREISNCLPDELGPLRDLPDVLDQMALVLAGDEPATATERELAKLVQQMSRTINELNRRLERLHAEKKAGSPRRLFADAFYTNAGAGFGKMVSSRLFWGGVVSSGLVLMGVGSEAATDKLAWMCNELILPEETEVVQMPSPFSEGGAKFVRPTEE